MNRVPQNQPIRMLEDLVCRVMPVEDIEKLREADRRPIIVKDQKPSPPPEQDEERTKQD